MERKKQKAQSIWNRICAMGIVVLFILGAGPAVKAQSVDPEADQVLREMSAYLGGTAAFSMNADIDFEILTQTGQKLQLSSFATVVMQRPAKFHVHRRGMLSDVEFIYDGKTLTLNGRNLNVYASWEVAGTSHPQRIGAATTC